MAKTTIGASATEKKKDMWMRAALLLLLLLRFVDANPRGYGILCADPHYFPLDSATPLPRPTKVAPATW